MPDKLIINARDHLSWQQRLFSSLTTLILWISWLLMWRPMIHRLIRIWHYKHSLIPAVHMLKTLSPVSIGHALIALIGTCVTLLLWTFLPGRKHTYSHTAQTIDDYADYFHLDKQSLIAGRSASICIVHHDANGHIVNVEVPHTT